MHSIALIVCMMIVSLRMHVIAYSCHDNVWGKVEMLVISLIGLLGMCEVMGIHIYIALVDIDWDYE